MRELRLARGLTQEALAEQSGLSYKFVGEVERGGANPTLDTIESLASALGVGPGELVRTPHAFSETSVSESDYAIVRDALSSLQTVFGRVGPRKRRSRGRKST